jgi:hypothetical protein
MADRQVRCWRRPQIKREGGEAAVAPLKWGAEASMQRVLAEHGPFDFILGSDILYSRAAYGDLLRTITFFSQPHTRTWLACPRRDEGLGDGYGGKYFASGAEATLQLLCCAVLRPRHVAIARTCGQGGQPPLPPRFLWLARCQSALQPLGHSTMRASRPCRSAEPLLHI